MEQQLICPAVRGAHERPFAFRPAPTVTHQASLLALDWRAPLNLQPFCYGSRLREPALSQLS
jgi:hypothetical protein